MKWKSENQHYLFQQGEFFLTANPNNLAQGIQLKKDENVILQAFRIPAQDLVECEGSSYCRGADIYSSFQDCEHVAECYWRLESADPCQVTLEFILSIRSGVLLPKPAQFQVGVQFLKHGFKPIENLEHCSYSPVANLSTSLVVHPSDHHEVNLATTCDAIDLSMVTPQMERGVIRRIRVLLEIKQGLATAKTLADLTSRFSKSTIPLTT